MLHSYTSNFIKIMILYLFSCSVLFGFSLEKEAALQKVSQSPWNLQVLPEKFHDDFDIVMKAVTQNAHTLEYASKRLKNNKTILLAAVKENSTTLQYASEALKNDEQLVLIVVKAYGGNLKYVSKSMRDNKKVVMAALGGERNSFDNEALKYVSKRLQDDKEVVLQAVKYSGVELQYASSILKDDEEVVTEATKGEDVYYLNTRYFKYASKRVRGNKKIVLQLMSSKDTGIKSKMLEFFSDKLRDDKEVVRAALDYYGHSEFMYASSLLKNDRAYVKKLLEAGYDIYPYLPKHFGDDRELMKIAISHYAVALQYASKALLDDKELVIISIKNFSHHDSYFSSYRYKNLSQRLQKDREIYLLRLNHGVADIEDAGAKIQNDYGMAYDSIRSSSTDFCELSKTLKDNKTLALMAVKKNAYVIQCASKRLQNDEDIVKAALQQYPDTFQYVGESFKEDKKLVLKLMSRSDKIFKFAAKNLQDDEEVLDVAIKKDPYNYCYAGDRIRKDKKIAFKVVGMRGGLLECVDKVLKDDKELVILAQKSNPSALIFASTRFLDDYDLVKKALDSPDFSLKYASLRLQQKHEFINLAYTLNNYYTMVPFNGSHFWYANPKLTHNKEFLTYVLTKNPSDIRFAKIDIKEPPLLNKKTRNQPKNIQRKDNEVAFDASSVVKAKKLLFPNTQEAIQKDYYKHLVGSQVYNKGAMSTHIKFKKYQSKIAYFQYNENKKALMAFVEAKKETHVNNFAIGLKANRFIEVVGEFDGKLHSYMDDINIIYEREEYSIDKSITLQQYQRLQTHRVKLKIYKRKDKGSYKMKMMMGEPMLEANKAKEFGVKSDFITEIILKGDKEELLRFHLSPYVIHKPIIKLSFKTKRDIKKFTLEFHSLGGRIYTKQYSIKQ